MRSNTRPYTAQERPLLCVFITIGLLIGWFLLVGIWRSITPTTTPTPTHTITVLTTTFNANVVCRCSSGCVGTYIFMLDKDVDPGFCNDKTSYNKGDTCMKDYNQRFNTGFKVSGMHWTWTLPNFLEENKEIAFFYSGTGDGAFVSAPPSENKWFEYNDYRMTC